MLVTDEVHQKHLKFAYNFHEMMEENNLMLAYEGEMSQQLTKAFSSLAEMNLEKGEESGNVRRRVFHIMVECLQNVAKHTDDPDSGENVIPGSGIILVGKQEGQYTITTGNVIAQDKVAFVLELIEKINLMDKDEIKKFYKNTLRSGALSDKAGAGLGFIDMVKKTGNKINYTVIPINDKTSFFLYKVEVSRV
jgi:hypothetical protein